MKYISISILLFFNLALFCQEDVTGEVTQPSNAICTDGQINLTINGGISPISFDWSNGDSSEDITNLSPGEYNVTVTDGLCREIELNFELSCCFTPVQVDIDPFCDNDDMGSISLYWIGEAPYYINWTGPNGYTGQGSNIDNLEPGVYTASFDDTRYCSFSIDYIVESEVDFVVVDWGNPYCGSYSDDNGFIEIMVNSSGPFQVEWYRSNQAYPYGSVIGTGEYIENLVEDNYIAIIRTQNCEIMTGEFRLLCCLGPVENPDNPVNFLKPEIVDLGMLRASDSQSCDGSVAITLNLPNYINVSYELTMLPNDIPIPLDYFSCYADVCASDLCAGEYCLTINTGCRDSRECFIVESCDDIQIDISSEITSTCPGYEVGEISVSATGGDAPYSFKWSNGETTSLISDLASGNYTVTVIESGGCSKAVTFNVNEIETERNRCDLLCGEVVVFNYGEEIQTVNPDNCAEVFITCSEESMPFETVQSQVSWRVNGSQCQAWQVNELTGDICPGTTIFGENCTACYFDFTRLSNGDSLVVNCNINYCYFEDPQLNLSIIQSMSDYNNPVVVLQVNDPEKKDSCIFKKYEVYNNCINPNDPVIVGTVDCDESAPYEDGLCLTVFDIGEELVGDFFGGCENLIPSENELELTKRESSIKSNYSNLYTNSDLCNRLLLGFLAPYDAAVKIYLEDKEQNSLFSLNHNVVKGINKVLINNNFYKSVENGEYTIVIEYSSGLILKKKIDLYCAFDNVNNYCYPNPFSNEINIDLRNLTSENNILIELFSPLGEMIQYKEIDKNDLIRKEIISLDLSEYSNGSYLVKIFSGKELMSVEKIIKL